MFFFGVLTNGYSAESTSVVVSTTKGRPYYHLKYSLTKKNVTHIDLFTSNEIIRNGGQFQLLIKKEKFPVIAPNCKSDLILRMPWTDPDLANSQKFIKEKNSVYSSIQNLLKSTQNESVDVYIELNPYVKFKDNKFNLTQCNIFFRQSHGQYISKVGENYH